jgi:hypothetical protein
MPVDMDEGALTLTRRIGDPGKALLDQLTCGGSACVESSGERGKCWIRHVCWPDYMEFGGMVISRSSSTELSGLRCASSAWLFYRARSEGHKRHRLCVCRNTGMRAARLDR